MKIAIAGAGAMGCRFGYQLRLTGHEVLLIDGWQDHIDAVRRDGLQINYNGKEVVSDLPMYAPSELDTGYEAELIILFTKAMQLDDMLKAIKPIITNKTMVLCLLNGIGHEDILALHVKQENILLGNTMWTAGMEGPGKIKLFGHGSVDLQNLHPQGEAFAKQIASVLSAADLNARYSDNVLHAIYKKACVNGTMNGLCTLLDANLAGIGATSQGDAIICTIVDEIITVAKAEGIALDRQEALANIRQTFNPDTIGLHYPSMYQDLIKNNRLTEIDYINGAISRKGKKHGIPTPYCDFLTQLIHCKEDILGAE